MARVCKIRWTGLPQSIALERAAEFLNIAESALWLVVENDRDEHYGRLNQNGVWE